MKFVLEMMDFAFKMRDFDTKMQAGLHLHAGGSPSRPSNLLTWFDGKTHCEYINVAYQLQDVNCDGQRDGGFNCIPGNHLVIKHTPTTS